MLRRRHLAALPIAACLVLQATAAFAASAPDRGTAFVPKPSSKPLYGTQAPEEDPETQTIYIEAHDGTDLYVETYLPAPKEGNNPPTKIPTVLVMTPYAAQYSRLGDLDPFIEYMTQRGFALAIHHVRGSGNSGGCLEQNVADQVSDGAYVIEYLGREAPWSNGRVGMYGASYDAETQISTAAFGEPERIKYLKAIIPTATVASQYEWNYMDGVPWSGESAQGNLFYLGLSLLPEEEPDPVDYPDRAECQDEVMSQSLDHTGDFTEFWRVREYRDGAPRVKAATLMVHGLRDFNVQPLTLAGFFDRLPKDTPHKGLFGVWHHAYPNSHESVEPDWARADWLDMVVAWFDRYLKQINTGVEKWPAVQVQASDGQWWAVKEFPTTGSRVGQLALGPEQRLGVRKPQGETIFQEQMVTNVTVDTERAVFQTRRLRAPLHVTGQPMLDLWFMSDQPDAHIAVELEVIGSDGQPVTHEGLTGEAAATYGVRSMQHIDPMPRGWFEQERGEAITTGEPLRATIRFLPTDLLVPKGGRLRLTVSGSVAYSKGESLPSGSGSTITILHHCGRASTLRFRIPAKRATLVNVRETDEAGKLRSRAAHIGDRDGANIATGIVCGKHPRPLRWQ